MLHIILGILKIIGIILLVLICLVLLLLLAVAFSPVRYRLVLQKQSDTLYGQAKLSWLLHLIGVTIEYRNKEPVFTIRLFGINLEKVMNWLQQRKSRPKHQKTERTKRQKNGREVPEAPKTIETSEVKPKVPKTIETSEVEPEVPKTIEMSEVEPEVSKTIEMQETEPEEPKRMEPPEVVSEQEATSKPQKKTTATRSEQAGETSPREKNSSILKILKGIWTVIKKVFGFILSIPERLLDLSDKFFNFMDSSEKKIEKLSELKESVLQMLHFLQEETSKQLYARLFGHLNYIWKHYQPRKVEGWLQFGTGAPDLTGELTGVIYLLMPMAMERYELRPDFTEAVFETDTVIVGHIRACHLIRTAFLLWRDRELRPFIARAKHKGAPLPPEKKAGKRKKTSKAGKKAKKNKAQNRINRKTE